MCLDVDEARCDSEPRHIDLAFGRTDPLAHRDDPAISNGEVTGLPGPAAAVVKRAAAQC
jgi:hypothetical protein